MSLILSGTDGLSDVDGSAATPAIRGTDANTGIFFPAADTIAFAEGGAECARFDSSGNFMVGTTSPTNPANKNITLNANSTDAAIVLSLSDTRTGQLYVASSEVRLSAVTSVPLTFRTADTERMRLDSAGNLGLGVTPSGWNTSYKAFQFSSSGGLYGTTGNTYLGSNVFVNSGGANTYITTAFASMYRQTDGKHLWYTAASGTAGNSITFTNPMTLDASGNLCVGTTSVNNSGKISISADSASSQGMTIKETSTGNNIYYIYFTNSDGNGAGRIEHSGATTVNYVTSSDARLKTNIVDSGSARQVIEAIKIREFDWVSGEHQNFGVVAQELVEIAPEAVSVAKNEDDNWGVDYSKLVPHLVKYAQEQQALITTLTERITALENK